MVGLWLNQRGKFPFSIFFQFLKKCLCISPHPFSDRTQRQEREVMLKLKEVVDKQRDELRAKVQEISNMSSEVEAVWISLYIWNALQLFTFKIRLLYISVSIRSVCLFRFMQHQGCLCWINSVNSMSLSLHLWQTSKAEKHVPSMRSHPTIGSS